jgi:hypothetical protein
MSAYRFIRLQPWFKIEAWIKRALLTAELFEANGSIVYYKGADKSLAQPTSQCILSAGQNISFDASLVIYINSTNIPPIMIINRIYEHQNLLSL